MLFKVVSFHWRVKITIKNQLAMNNGYQRVPNDSNISLIFISYIQEKSQNSAKFEIIGSTARQRQVL